MIIKGVHYQRDEFGFLKQKNTHPFPYTKDYLSKQGTNVQMANLRISWVRSLGCNFNVAIDIGVGSGVMVKELKKICETDGYDVCPSENTNVSLKEATSKNYDIAFFCDVVEHFPDIRHIFDFKFNTAYFSFPWTPDKIPPNYRHGKPDEHIYHLNPNSFKKLCSLYNYKVIAISNFEDTIRKPWSVLLPNICSILIKAAAE